MARAMTLIERTSGATRLTRQQLRQGAAAASASAAANVSAAAAVAATKNPTSASSSSAWEPNLLLFQGAIVGFFPEFDDEETVRARLLQHPGVSPFAREPRHGMTLLHKAAQLGDVRLTQFLLDRGAEVEAKDNRCGKAGGREVGG